MKSINIGILSAMPEEIGSTIENLDNILEKSNIFEFNSNIEYIKCYIFYSDPILGASE